MKKQHSIALVGDKTENLSSNQPVLEFIGAGVKVVVNNGKDAVLTTHKGTYTLIKHPVLGIYQATINGFKVHLTHKAWVGQLIYWS